MRQDRDGGEGIQAFSDTLSPVSIHHTDSYSSSPHLHALLLQAVVDGRVQLQLLGALHCLEPNDNM